MKKIIVCEGESDSIFLRENIKLLGFSDKELKLFHQSEGVKLPSQKYEETKVLKNFVYSSPHNPQKILIKNECNKDSAVKLFCSELIHHLCNAELTILLDCDSLSVKQKQDSIKKHTKNHFNGKVLDLDFNTEQEHEHLHHSTCYVNVDGGTIGKFNSIFFRSDLETACGIDDTEEREEKNKKISTFVIAHKTPSLFLKIIKKE